MNLIQYFLRLRCLVRQFTDCEGNCNRFTESALTIYISHGNTVLW